MKRTKQPSIQEIGDKVHLDCSFCRVHTTVSTKDAKSAYRQINRFRIVHEHQLNVYTE